MFNDYKALNVTKKQLKSLDFFWLGFIIYTLGDTFSTLINIKVCQGVQILGLVLIVIKIPNVIQLRIKNQYLKFMYWLYCIWLFSLIIKDYALLTDYVYLKSFLFSPYEGMLYFSPLILLFPRNWVFFKKIFDVIVIFGICYLLTDLLFIKALMSADRSNRESQGIVETFSNLSFSSGFLMLTYIYHSKKRQLFAIGIVILALLLAIFKARRGLILMYSGMVFTSYLMYLYYSTKKISILYVTIFIALLGALYISSVYKPRNNRVYGFAVDRGNEDTRTVVETFYYDDMKTKDWIAGRGIRGEYFCPNVEENQLTNYRFVIETGYLQTILKGGLISLGLFLLIAVPAVIKGLFYSRNMLSKAAAIWILLSLVYSYPATVNAFTLSYLLVWVSIGICYSKELRNMSEKTIQNILHTL